MTARTGRAPAATPPVNSAFKLPAAKQEKLRQAWYGPHSLIFLTHMFGLSSWQAVRGYWTALQDQGLLPAGARPGDATCEASPLAPPLQSNSIVFAGVDDDDDAPDASTTTFAYGARLPDPDPLLALLQRCHGNDSFRALDGMPEKILNQERAGIVPAREQIREFARIRDVFVSALLRISKPRRRTIGATAS